MMKGEASRTSVRKVRQATQQHARGLLAENERLRSMIAALGCDRVRLEERVKSLDAALKELDLLHKARQEAQQQVREETIKHMANHDSLTGLPNRSLLQERLRQAIGEAREGRPLALLLVDLDRFKEINDTFGHENGDQVILRVGRRLGQILGDPERVSRLRGDEFAVLLPGAETEVALQLAYRIMKSLEEPFAIEGLSIEIGASIGISVGGDPGGTVDGLLRQADMAMRVAKRDHSGCVVYSLECDPYSPRRLVFLGELRRAIEGDQLRLQYQPKVDLSSRAVIGVEALVRWQHPRLGLVPPDQFVALAEQGGLIRPLTRWVLNEALTQCRLWQRSCPSLSMAVNLSARNLQDANLAELVAGLLDKKGVPPESLALEITESAVMAEPERAGEILRSLEASGVRLAIDDFGTGYSSLVCLRKLPVSEIKIDKSFVMGVTANEGDRVIVRSTSDLAHNLGLKVVAEGVEDLAALDLLGSFGCDAAQGFFLGRPMAPSDLAQWMKESPWTIAEAGRPGFTRR